jgi:hypothetical protein
VKPATKTKTDTRFPHEQEISWSSKKLLTFQQNTIQDITDVLESETKHLSHFLDRFSNNIGLTT